jgi:hypothetical protein
MKKSASRKPGTKNKSRYASYLISVAALSMLICTAWYVFIYSLRKPVPAPSHAAATILEMRELNVIPEIIVVLATKDPLLLTADQFRLAVRMAFVDCLRRAEVGNLTYDQLNIKACVVASSESKKMRAKDGSSTFGKIMN